jgi:predicted RNase H-like HicB family nuclease
MSSRADRSSTEETITVYESDGKIVARDESTGVSSFGESKTQALERLSEALELYEQPVPEDDEPDAEATAPWL